MSIRRQAKRISNFPGGVELQGSIYLCCQRQWPGNPLTVFCRQRDIGHVSRGGTGRGWFSGPGGEPFLEQTSQLQDRGPHVFQAGLGKEQTQGVSAASVYEKRPAGDKGHLPVHGLTQEVGRIPGFRQVGGNEKNRPGAWVTGILSGEKRVVVSIVFLRINSPAWGWRRVLPR